MAPRQHFLQRRVGTGEFGFHRPIGPVANPSGEAVHSGLARCRVSEPDALHPAADEKVQYGDSGHDFD